ncbi:hypothetical protein HK104_010561, partial [Borealophlyctis nickersoniae]
MDDHITPVVPVAQQLQPRSQFPPPPHQQATLHSFDPLPEQDDDDPQPEPLVAAEPIHHQQQQQLHILRPLPQLHQQPFIQPRSASRIVPVETYSYVHPFETDDSDFAKNLKCKSCGHIYTTPFILPCCHSRICMGCVKGKCAEGVSGGSASGSAGPVGAERPVSPLGGGGAAFYCSTCLDDNGQHRVVETKDLGVDSQMKEVVDDLDVYCIRRRKGCEWVGPRKYLFVHVAEECILAP